MAHSTCLLIAAFSAVLFSTSIAFSFSPGLLTSRANIEKNMVANADYECNDGCGDLSRRFFIGVVAAVAITSGSPSIAIADAIAIADDTQSASTLPKERKLVSGTVAVKSVEGLPEDTSSSAVYITARPSKADNIPRAILDGSNGKPPPVLASRIPNPKFPYDFQLSTLDLTQEGAAFMPNDRYWFEGQDLTISARWDTDGVASTRDPTDLVGRSQFYSSKNNDIIVELSGRGMTGKLVTGKAKN